MAQADTGVAGIALIALAFACWRSTALTRIRGSRWCYEELLILAAVSEGATGLVLLAKILYTGDLFRMSDQMFVTYIRQLLEATRRIRSTSRGREASRPSWLQNTTWEAGQNEEIFVDAAGFTNHEDV